jgi:hypothetical protein
MKSTRAIAIVAAGLIVVGEVLPDEHKTYWLNADHSHVEFPEGTTSHGSQMAYDSGAMTNTANTAFAAFNPYISIVG